jgi:hypothetical protein
MKMKFKKQLSIATLVFSLLQCAACITPVQPWEKEVLAQAHMAIEPDALDRLLDEQVVTSKEASSGGFGVVGGGCGCK